MICIFGKKPDIQKYFFQNIRQREFVEI